MTKEELSELVKATGLKQSEVAAKLDLSPVTLNRWLAGNPLPPHPNMVRKALQLLTLEQRGAITEKFMQTGLKPIHKQYEEDVERVAQKLGLKVWAVGSEQNRQATWLTYFKSKSKSATEAIVTISIDWFDYARLGGEPSSDEDLAKFIKNLIEAKPIAIQPKAPWVKVAD